MDETIFIAQVDLLGAFAFRLGESRPILRPTLLESRRAFWTVLTEEDPLGTTRPVGMRITLEFVAGTLREAQSLALKAGRAISPLIALHAGSPISTPRLVRIAEVGGAGGVLAQHDYYYLDSLRRWPSVPLTADGLEGILRRYGSVDYRERDALTLAARWYATSIGAADLVDAYLSVWIGLEAVGPLLDARFHKAGARAPCRLCGNQAGMTRDRKEAGIEHQIRRRAPEVLERFSLRELISMRNAIAHPFGTDRGLAADSPDRWLISQLHLVLATGTLDALTTDQTKGGLSAILPRDFQERPDARATVRFSQELVGVSPWLNQWAEVRRIETDQYSALEDDGAYVEGHGVGVQTRVVSPTPAEGRSEYTEFERAGRSHTPKSDDSSVRQHNIEPWDDFEVPDSWDRARRGEVSS